MVVSALLASHADHDRCRAAAGSAIPASATRHEVSGFGAAQAHLPTTVSVDRIIEPTGTNVGPVALQQIRELVADLLGI